MQKSKRICCVVGCHASEYSSIGKYIAFHRFPGRPWEAERKSHWIAAVNRINQDGTSWQPSQNARICSSHIVGGQKSDHPNNPAYIPTVFPPVNRKRSLKESDISRFQRAEKRKVLRTITANTDSVNISVGNDSVEEEPTLKSVSTQVGLDIDDNVFIFVASSFGNEFSGQCNIGGNVFKSKDTRDNFTATIDPFERCKGFHGFHDIVAEGNLKELTSTEFMTFNLLMSFLPSFKSFCMLKENILLLFLTKMKLGLSFSALGIVFNLHRTSAARIFVRVLNVLVQKTDNLIFWPSKEDVQGAMPRAFKEHFSQTRAIIDCMEIKTEAPSNVSQIIFMYSKYKSCYTFKLLIAVTQNGFILFKSKCYGGRCSDTYVTNHSGFLNLLEEGDIILADKGFPGIMSSGKKVIVNFLPPIIQEKVQ